MSEQLLVNNLNNLSDEEKKKLKAAAKRYIENNQYLFYTPNGKSSEFIKSFGKNEKMVYLFLGGNGASKSCTMANIVASICFPNLSEYFRGLPLFTKWPYLKKIRIISDPTTIQEKTVPELKKWFPQGRYETNKKKKNFDAYFSTDTGFEINLMTYDQDVKEFESVDLGAVFFDEPPPEAIFKASISRLRLGGVMGIFMTPLGSAGYLYDKYIERPDKTVNADWIYVDIEDNCKQHGIRGFLDHRQIEMMVEHYDEAEKEARVHGKFMHLAGVIFKEFDKKKHVLETFEATVKRWVPKTWKVYWAIDQHPVRQTAVTFMAIMADGRKVVIDEIWEHIETGNLAAKIFNKLNDFKNLGGSISELGLIDPSSVIEDQLRGGSSIKTDFLIHWKKLGASFGLLEGSKDRDRAEDMIHQELKGTISPNLYICSNCSQTIWEFGRFQTDPKNHFKRMDKDDHFIENIGRLVINNPHLMFTTTRAEKRRKIIMGIGS